MIQPPLDCYFKQLMQGRVSPSTGMRVDIHFNLSECTLDIPFFHSYMRGLQENITMCKRNLIECHEIMTLSTQAVLTTLFLSMMVGVAVFAYVAEGPEENQS